LTDNRLQSGIENVRRYYQKHDHLLATVTLSRLEHKEDTNTVIPTISINPGPLVKVSARGAKLSRGKQRQLLPIYQERSVDRSLLVEGTRNLVEYSSLSVYFDVAVDFDISPSSAERRPFSTTSTAGNGTSWRTSRSRATQYFTEETIRERMYMAPASILRFRHGRYSQRYLERDVDSIEDLYRSNGFRDVRVTSNVVDDYLGRNGD